MKFFNFKNSHTNDNIIYSKKDIANMTVRDAFKNQDAIMAQHRAIGVPSEAELQASPNAVYVHAYVKDDGTQVRAHWRSLPDGNPNITSPIISAISNNVNNLNKTDNNNESITGGAAQINDDGQIEITQGNYYKLTVSKEVYEKLYPSEIVGVKRGKEMSYDEVFNRGVYPSFEQDIENNIYNGNCHSCTIAYEYNRRGFKVNAGSTYSNPKSEELSHNAFDAWIDPSTGKVAKWTKIHLEEQSAYEYLSKNVKPGERYELGLYPQLEEGEPDTIGGHVVIVEKNQNNQLIIVDPQENIMAKGNDKAKMFLYSWIDCPEAVHEIHPNVIRIDDKQLNPYYLPILEHSDD